MKTTALLVIDAQNDFCDIPPDARVYAPVCFGPAAVPALPVTGAHADMLRLACLIERVSDRIGEAFLTLDTHAPFDIGHPAYWRDAAGNVPAPYAAITSADIQSGRWMPRDPDKQPWVLTYALAVEAQGLRGIEIWPEHVIGGSWGHGLHPAVQQAVNAWSRGRGKPVNFVFKGTHPDTESYSAMEAILPIPGAVSTQYNQALAEDLARADEVLVGGEASSHCVASTVRSLLKAPCIKPERLVLLLDCMSPVPGFEAQAEAFFAEMAARGVRTTLSTEYNP